MTPYELQQADVQGRLFELAVREGLPAEPFVKAFMTGEVARGLDAPFSRYQWAGEEYLLEEVRDEGADALARADAGPHRSWPSDALYWAGYLYRCWHFLTGESSAKIYRQAPAGVVLRNYPMFHTLDPAMAIEDLAAMGKRL